jgi:hypothetical protein
MATAIVTRHGGRLAAAACAPGRRGCSWICRASRAGGLSQAAVASVADCGLASVCYWGYTPDVT